MGAPKAGICPLKLPAKFHDPYGHYRGGRIHGWSAPATLICKDGGARDFRAVATGMQWAHPIPTSIRYAVICAGGDESKGDVKQAREIESWPDR